MRNPEDSSFGSVGYFVGLIRETVGSLSAANRINHIDAATTDLLRSLIQPGRGTDAEVRAWFRNALDAGDLVRTELSADQAAGTTEQAITVTRPNAEDRQPQPLPLAVGRIQSYCGRVDRPHAGHVWTTEPGRWCPGDEVPGRPEPRLPVTRPHSEDGPA